MAAPMPDPMDTAGYSGGFYMQYLESLCRRRGWLDPMYECRPDIDGYMCIVRVNGRDYQTDLSYQSDFLAQENAAMRAFMVCRNFSVNGGMLARNGIVQGLPAPAGEVMMPAPGVGAHRNTRYPPSSSHGSSSSHWDPVAASAQPVPWDAASDSQSRHNRSNSNSTASCDGE